MKIAVYSLTRDRLWATRPCFESLRAKAGAPFFHLVVDNGSTDGSAEWLADEYRPDHLIRLPQNIGISRASNLALAEIFRQQPDVEMVVKVDNDCFVQTDGILAKFSQVFAELMGPLARRWVLSPRVEGISRQPTRVGSFWTQNFSIGPTSIVGGLFHVVPADIYREYEYPVDLPLAKGQDDHFCAWVKLRGGGVGYVENLVVEHYMTTDGQAKQDPTYFERKFSEETAVPK